MESFAIVCMEIISTPLLNPLYTGGLFHYYMLNEFICQFGGVRSIFVALIIFLIENPVSKQSRP